MYHKKLHHGRKAKNKIIWQMKDNDGMPDAFIPADIGRAVLDFAAAVLFLLSAMQIYKDLICKSEQVRGSTQVSGAGYIILLLFFMVFALDIIGKLQGKYHFEVWLLAAAAYAAGLSFFAWKYRSDLEMGFCQLGNIIGEFVSNYYHVSIALPSGYIKDIPLAAGFLFACMAVFFLLAADICACRILMGIMPLLVLLAGLSVGYAPKVGGLTIGFAGLLLSGAGAWQSGSVFFHRTRRSEWISPLVRLLPVLLTVLLSLFLPAGARLFFTKQTEKIAIAGKDILAKQKQLENRIMEMFVPSGDSGDFGTVDNHMPRYQHKEVLQVDIEGNVGADQYLRGYFGTDYVDGKWMTDEDAFSLACSKEGYDAKEIAEYASTLGESVQIVLAGNYVSVEPKSSCTVRYINFSSNEAFMPYNQTRTGSYVEQKNKDGSFTYVPYELPGEKKYETAADIIRRKPGEVNETEWNIWPGEWTNALIKDIDEYRLTSDMEEDWQEQWYQSYVEDTYLTVDEDIPSVEDIAARIEDEMLQECLQDWWEVYYDSEKEYYDGFQYIFEQPEGKTVLTYTLSGNGGDGKVEIEYGLTGDDVLHAGNYLVFENEAFKYDMLTMEKLIVFFGVERDYGWRNDNLLRYDFAQCTAQKLSEYTYNTKLSSLPAGRDAVEYFLEESHEGYCTHFASAGVMILRRLGVPARYATGYIISADAFKRIGNGQSREASVQDDNAHAWVEIYLDNIGWIPVEMTPGYGNVPEGGQVSAGTNPAGQERQDTGSEKENRATETQDAKSPEHNTEETPDETQKEAPDTGAGKAGNGSASGGRQQDAGFTRMAARVAAVFAGILMAICAAAGTVLFFARRRKRLTGKLESEIRQKRNRRAVNRINRLVYRKMRRKGHILGKNMPDSEYGKKLAELFAEGSREDWEQFMMIVKKARFSAKDIENEEAELCHKMYKLLFVRR